MVTKQHLNTRLLRAEYAVRGPIVARAQQLEEQGKKIIYCNIGNPQALKQPPLSFVRQMLSLLEYPALMEEPSVLAQMPDDIVARVRSFLSKHPPGTGAYTQSTGIPFIREAVAEFIRKRDEISASRDNIILTDGASKGVQAVLTALLKGPNDGFMIPVPQYPLYSASLTLYGGEQIGYYLDEAQGWQLDESLLENTLKEARARGVHAVAIVVINPGNPTGAVLSKDNIRMIVGFARRHGLAILADEVYQENVYTPGARFFSFARIMNEMGEKDVSLFSVHSVSKGFLGECGHRGGYLECRNLPADVMAEFVKLQSISLCANVPGQIATYCMVSPPRPGETSYDRYVAERDAILASLKRKAELLAGGINGVEGLSVEIPQGAMYAFVRLELPPARSKSAESMTSAERIAYETEREFAYCMALLEQTGICVVPGAGFGQPPGTMHFRTTFLPPEAEMEKLVARLRTFHEQYIRLETAPIG
jgi:aspartate/methionine/tyrosine aminotransferase